MNNRVAIYGFDQDGVIIAGTYNTGFIDTSQRFNGQTYNTSQANNDELFYTRYFTKGGLYKVRLIYTTQTDGAKVDIGLDSNGANNIFSQIDEYSASLTRNIVKETIMEIRRGYHDIHFKCNGKNASSSAYTNRIQALELDLIQEHPVYQDDRPAQINQGSMVLLGKHTAAVAESTFTFNFAGITDDLYSEIIVIARGQATAALSLQLVINGGSTGYYQDGVSAIGGTNANIDINNAAQLTFQSSSILNGANQEIEANAIIKGSKVGTSRPTGRIEAGTFSIGMEESAFGCGSVTTPVTSITVKTSTSTWIIGTVIEVYGIRKV